VTYYVRGGQLVNLVGIVEQDHWPYDDWTCQGNKQDIVAAYAKTGIRLLKVF
jgi:salicylate hydroxylase